MNDIPLIRELLDPFLTVGEAAACRAPALERRDRGNKNLVKNVVAENTDDIGADAASDLLLFTA